MLACGFGGGGVDRGDIRCPGTINWMAGIIVAVSNNVSWSGVMSVDSSASPSAASEYALCAALSCENTSPIFTQVDVSGKLCYCFEVGDFGFVFCHFCTGWGWLQAFGHHRYLCQVLVCDRFHHGVDTRKTCQVPDWDESIMVGFNIFLLHFPMDVISQGADFIFKCVKGLLYCCNKFPSSAWVLLNGPIT